MVCSTTDENPTFIHRLDPRCRVLAGLAFAVVLALSARFQVLGAGLGAGALAVFAARLPPRALLRRLAALNGFMAILLVVLPLTSPGTELFRLGPLSGTAEGLARAAGIALKGNAIVLCLSALVGTMELVTLGHALERLKLPSKLVHLLLFSARYVDVLQRECRRLLNSIRARGFSPGMTLHTYRTLGYLAGMLLVRSFDRSERILAAMKCRGFDGRFHVLATFAPGARDVGFGLVATLFLFALVWLERAA